MADTQLLPCPFCGGDAQTDFIEGESYLIECYACRAETGIKDSEEDAIAAWNRRAALASRPAEVDDERQWVVVGGRRAGRTFLAALARDAERYRWMRNAQWFKAGIAKTELSASSFHYSGDLLDQLVDAGRAAGVHGEGAGK
jgi:Lar family restriction alleviation protein